MKAHVSLVEPGKSFNAKGKEYIKIDASYEFGTKNVYAINKDGYRLEFFCYESNTSEWTYVEVEDDQS